MVYRVRIAAYIASLLVLLFTEIAQGQPQQVGHINLSIEKCSFNDAIFVYDSPRVELQKSVGVLQDGAKVYISPTPVLTDFYKLQGDDAEGKRIHGYVEKGCVAVSKGVFEQPPEIVTETTPQPAARAYNRPPPILNPVDCNKFGADLPGCKSFNELLAANDKDVTVMLGVDNEAYTCFRTDEDVFVIVSMEKPEPERFKKVANQPYSLVMFAVAYVEKFENGVSQDNRIFTGNWKKFSTLPNREPSFSSKLAESSLFFGESEINISYTWKNLKNTNTFYMMNIRRSTHRFVETFEVPPAAGDKDRSTQQMTKQGYCVEYNVR